MAVFPALVLLCLAVAWTAAGATSTAVPSLNYELVRIARTVREPGQELVVVLLGCIHSPSLIRARNFQGGALKYACEFSQCLGKRRGLKANNCPLLQPVATNTAVMVILDDVSCPGGACSLESRNQLKQQAMTMGAQVFGVVSEVGQQQLQLSVMALAPNSRLPVAASYIQDRHHSTGTVFQDIYDRNVWTAEGRGSGPGSTVPYTANIRKYLVETVQKHNIRTILDAPNGGMNWMPLVLDELGPQLERYTGLDIAHNVVARHLREFQKRRNWEFFCVDVCQQRLLPGYDLVFSRDAMQHLPYSYVFSFLRNVKESGAKWLMIGSYLESHENRDIGVGDYFRINLLDPPFNCSQPADIFDEKTPDMEKKYALLYNVAEMQCADGADYAAARAVQATDGEQATSSGESAGAVAQAADTAQALYTTQAAGTVQATDTAVAR